MSLRDIRINSGPGRAILIAPVLILLAGKALAGAAGVDVGAALGLDGAVALMLAAIAGYAFLIWRLTMNEHRAQQDELY